MNLTLPLLSLAAFATAMMSGLFYAFQWLVMLGLNATEPLIALRSMQAINLAVRNVFFMFAFLGRWCSAGSRHCFILAPGAACRRCARGRAFSPTQLAPSASR